MSLLFSRTGSGVLDRARVYGLMLTAPVALGKVCWLIDKEVFVRFGSNNPGPADDFSLFEEIFSVLAGMFDLVEIGLGDG